MTDILGDLAARIRSELDSAEHAAELASKRWRKTLVDEDYLGSVVLDLQSCYQGIERCLELVARIVDGAAPSGDQWHHSLLTQMTAGLPGVRPAVISEQTKERLDRLRRFRHVARHTYGFNLDVSKVATLVEDLPRTIDLSTRDLLAFADFLEEAQAGRCDTAQS